MLESCSYIFSLYQTDFKLLKLETSWRKWQHIKLLTKYSATERIFWREYWQFKDKGTLGSAINAKGKQIPFQVSQIICTNSRF